ncbi:NADH-ubiquinone oxidoreductase assembly factor N7BML [Podospora australis]|uniref:NADH-ubiquinone oxidoreductase assembly factor N7BML n=1 Tax=Podospora australis TaxID=1536484 RepID=A0AAN7AMZ0_9PEZI|nr:NADH-ubiquinone oxidoreductase assembly factor N7BML [Podospora australis]
MSGTGPQITPFLKAWYRWKTLRLPWRRQFLVGLDLQGNTYWEFRDRGTTSSSPLTKWRRIVRYPGGRSTHPSDVVVPPQWHQWLRHTRPDPPSLAEQQADVIRQERLKILAAEADARWAAKPSYLDAPDSRTKARQPPLVGGSMLEEAKELPRDTKEEHEREREGTWEKMKKGQQEVESKEAKEKDPWKKARQGAPSDGWQPKAWTPGAGGGGGKR